MSGERGERKGRRGKTDEREILNMREQTIIKV